ncbi:PAS domain S-box protein [Mucilaginibacter corticis]|uniref:PAS domain S-box protein n=1 Tax=Mucilaginibacter corticis TaxID=2597670 RepID=A0A556MS41_9SPHI|nr:PAS domain S-box protein [Mucilaginibacter corticis]TSJ42733.1 PAS domain S-box protein [Mucilaginibacter corticis]
MKENILTKYISFYKFWNNYADYVKGVMHVPAKNQQSHDQLSNRLFTHTIIYALPVAFLALIPTTIIALNQKNPFLALFGIGIVLAVTCTAFNPYWSMSLRKFTVSAALVVMAAVLIVARGTFSIGYIYLLACSVFYALHLSHKIAIRAVLANLIFCILFWFIIAFHLIKSGPLATTLTWDWLIQSINFLFINIVIVVMIRYTIDHLEHTMKAENDAHQQLKDELREKQLLNDYLQESESRYKTLFSLSPSAKLIFDSKNLRFLETNKVASEVYGYSESEFLTMKLTDIHLKGDLPGFLIKHSDSNNTNNVASPVRSRHLRKDGSMIDVALLGNDINFKGNLAHILVVNDITRQIKQVNAIEKQNAKLRDVAYIQSHLVRLPLTKIMALTELIVDEFTSHGDQELLKALAHSSVELDNMIRKIVYESADILAELDRQAGESY